MLIILLALVVFAGVLSLKQLGLASNEKHNIQRDVPQVKIVEVIKPAELAELAKPVVESVVETVVKPVVEPKPVRPVKPVKPALRIPQKKTQPVKPDIHDIDVAVFVLSRRSAFETRQVIRQTWASGHNNVFFAVGKCCSIPPDDRKKYTCARSKSSSASSQTSWDAQCAAQDKKLTNEQQSYSDIITMPDVDVYRHLPQKVKYCYKWGLKNTKAKWFVKTDDDSVVRIGTLGSYLEKTYNSNNHMVIGRIAKGWSVPRSGKWAEKDYKPSKYPNFPLGSVGHVVSKSVALYIADNSDKLFNYQGEDVSLGIWLNESPLKVKWVTSKRMTNHGNCKDTGMWVIGHNIKPAKMKACFAHNDETIEKKYVGVKLMGGLGNNLFMLASTIGIARKNNAIPCYTGTNKANDLVELDIKKCPQTYAKQSERGYAKYTPFKMKKSTTVGTYLQSYKYFKSLLFKIKQNMNSFGHNYVKKHSKKATNVGIHVRRGDYLKYGYLNFPDDQYFKNAMQYFTDKYGDVQFFVVSNDIPWCKKQSFFKATHLVSEKHTAAQDMAILAICDHVIISIGTFGWWGGLLSGGEVVYNAKEFNMKHKTNKGKVVKDDYYPTSWKPLLSSNPVGCTLSLPWTPQKRGEEIKRFRKDGWNGRKYYSKASNFRSNAVILDVGAFDGVDIKNFMQSERSDVTIHTYEPVPTIFKRLQKNMKPFSNVHTYPFGVGGKKSDACFVQKGDATHSVSPDSPECQEKSEIRSIENVVSTFNRIDLLHINCEGCEYPILKKLLALPHQPVEAIEVQFHQAHVKPEEYCEIEKLLVARGYTMTYRYAFVWELWERTKKDAEESYPACKWQEDRPVQKTDKFFADTYRKLGNFFKNVMAKNSDDAFVLWSGRMLELYRFGYFSPHLDDLDLGNGDATHRPPKKYTKLIPHLKIKIGWDSSPWTMDFGICKCTLPGGYSFWCPKDMKSFILALYGHSWFIPLPNVKNSALIGTDLSWIPKIQQDIRSKLKVTNNKVVIESVLPFAKANQISSIGVSNAITELNDFLDGRAPHYAHPNMYTLHTPTRRMEWDGCQPYYGTDIQTGLFEQLKRVVSVFSRKGIRYALTYGSLIGVLREKNINSNEIDNDMVVDSSFSLTPNIVHEFREQNLHIFRAKHHVRICNLGSSSTKSHNHGGPYRVYTDLYLQLPQMKIQWNSVRSSEIYNVDSFESVKIRGLSVQIPALKIAYPFLKQKYGNWKNQYESQNKKKNILRKIKKHAANT